MGDFVVGEREKLGQFLQDLKVSLLHGNLGQPLL